MRKLVLVAHTSLDGFVAGTNGELNGFEAGQENLDFVCKLTETADAALFGRNSFQMLNSYWPTASNLPNASKIEIAYSNWYNAAHKIVLSTALPGNDLPNITIIRNNIASEISSIKKMPGKDILIFGSPAATQTLMQLDLIDSYWIFINPVFFGQGIPLFTTTTNKVTLTLLATKQFSNGELALHYEVKR